MSMKMNITAVALLLLLASAAARVSGDSLFDITKYGAKADGESDISQALLEAWKDACELPAASRVIIPDGIHALGQITIEGPCKSPIHFIVRGTVKAPADISRFNGEPSWVSFPHINQFILSDKGVCV